MQKANMIQFDERNKVREKVNRYIYDYFRDNTDGQDRIGFDELNVRMKLKRIRSCMQNMEN